jgi:hypothetical protein
MPRPFHSASSIALGARCRHAWALRYLAKLRSPDLTWSEIEAGADHTSRQRSAALGKAVHAVNEAWHLRQPVDWRGLPGEIALSGAHLMPHPGEALDVHVENGIGLVPLPPSDDGPRTALEVHGVRWVGYRDLLVLPSAAAAARLGVLPHWLLVDYKTTASIERYALTPDALRVDIQANMYALDVCEGFALDAIQARWIYYETKRVRRAQPVDVTIQRDDAQSMLEAPAALARELDAIERVELAPKNPSACGDYGGCPYHISAGGPCDARRSIGALIQARVLKKVNNMSLDPAVLAKFNAIKAGNGAAPPPAAEPVTAAGITPAPTTDVAAPAPVATRKPRTPRTPAAAASTPAPAAPTTTVGLVLALQAELAAAQAEVEAATAKRESVLAMIREAVAA